ncbi:transport and Golgi organization 2-like protein [Gossypium australe]|uniref:Transport and Golgi organization 2-like protein n=1 Tax=Gossypium australe TaxID=47621 RepID=A0A5B6VRZ5_9ROSI|nr:transport and Golgi organization 2-like protein [Gossypium australe]
MPISRPTEPLIWWEGGEILGGRDGQAGGTWLASSRDGRLAFITNFRELQSIPPAKSRGNLPVDFLQARNNAKLLITGSLSLFSNRSGVQKAGSQTK